MPLQIWSFGHIPIQIGAETIRDAEARRATMSVKLDTGTMKNVCDEETLDAERDDRRALRKAGIALPSIATLMLLVPFWVGAPLAGMVASLSFVDWARRTAQTNRIGGMRASCEVEGCGGFHRKDLQGWRGCSNDSSHRWQFGEMVNRPDVNLFWEPKIVGMVGLRINPKYRGSFWEKARGYWGRKFGAAWTRGTVVWRSGRGSCGHAIVWRMSGFLAGDVASGLRATARQPAFTAIADALIAEAREYEAMKPNKQIHRRVVFVDGYQKGRFGSMDCFADASLAPALESVGLKVRDAPRFQNE